MQKMIWNNTEKDLAMEYMKFNLRLITANDKKLNSILKFLFDTISVAF